MAKSAEAHPALKYPAPDRESYMVIVASIAAADRRLDSRELEELETQCDTLKLPAKARASVLAACKESPEDLTERLAGLHESELRFTLVTDMVHLALADGVKDARETKEIKRISKELGVSADQLAAIEKFVKATRSAAASGSTAEDLKAVGAEAAAGLAATGVPIAAVAIVGGGLNAAQIVAALAALGLGGGMLAGVGVLVGLGIGTYNGVKWLFGDSDTGRKKRS